METTDTTPPFGEYTVKFLLAGPAAGLPPDADAKAERVRCCGRHGQHVAALWRTHEGWLRQAATERGIRPSFPKGRYFGEAVARMAPRKGK